MKHLIVILAVFGACSSLNRDLESRDPLLLRAFPVAFKNGQLYKFETKDHEGLVSRLEFEDNAKAKSYAMERRLLILRKFEDLVEPYFGTANAKDCQNNLRSEHLETKDKSLSILLQVPVRGEEKVIHDCLKKNNTHWANIQFLVCDRNVYDIRTYTLISKKDSYEPKFRCKE